MAQNIAEARTTVYLGSAGGANALKLLKWILPKVGERNLEYIFEDLPSADFTELAATIEDAKLPENVLTSMIPKSFYEKLFGPNSIHLSLSFVALHWLSTKPDLSIFPQEMLNFTFVRDLPASTGVYEAYQIQAEKDLTQFLKLRADELIDGGFGLYLMVGSEREEANSRIMKSPEPLFFQAFLNTASEFASKGQSHLANYTKEAMAVAKYPIFYRNKKDIRDTLSQECFKNIFELVEVQSEECLLDNKTGVGMTNMMLSICENAMFASLRHWAEDFSQAQRDDDLATSGDDLTTSIMEAWKSHLGLLVDKNFPDGKFYLTYLYLVVKRMPR